jgi:hypothetical protein
VLVVKIIASVGAYSNSITGNDPNHPDRDVAKEHVMVEMSAEEYSATPAGKHDYYDGALDQWLSHDFAQMKRLMPVETNGQDIVWGPWVDIKAKADVDGGRITNPPDSSFQILSGTVWVEANYEAQPDNRSVKIVSPTIETSYYKSLTDPVTGLPAPAPLPNEPPVFYQAPNKRSADGSMTVDSAAQWLSANNHPNTVSTTATGYQWFGGGTFSAGDQNFTSPSYEWEIDPPQFNNGMINIYPKYSNGGRNIEFGPEDFSSLYTMGHYLGGNLDDGPSAKSTTLTVTVTDAADGAVGENTYKIRWHKPLENPFEYRNDDNDPAVKFTKLVSAQANIPAGGISEKGEASPAISVTLHPVPIGVKIRAVLWNGFLLGSTAYLGANVTIDPVVKAFLGSAFSQIYENPQPIMGPDQHNTYELWLRAKQSDLDPNYEPIRNNPKSTPEPMFISVPSTDLDWDASQLSVTDAMNDSFWQRSKLTDLSVRYYYRDRFFCGEEYGTNGFIGVQTADEVPYQSDSKFVAHYTVQRIMN